MYVKLIELQNEKKKQKKSCISNKDYMILEKFPSILSFYSYLVNLKSDFVFYYRFCY